MEATRDLIETGGENELMLALKTRITSGYRLAYEIFEPSDFFSELAKRGIRVHERVYEYRQIETV